MDLQAASRGGSRSLAALAHALQKLALYPGLWEIGERNLPAGPPGCALERLQPTKPPVHLDY
jgi:hypothetical protein